MRLPPRRAVLSLTLAVGGLAMASQAAAQAPGRYLTWPGKAERSTPRPVEARSQILTEARPADRGPIMSMPVQPMVAPVTTRYSARTSPGPTPASAWVAAPTPLVTTPQALMAAAPPSSAPAFVPAPPLPPRPIYATRSPAAPLPVPPAYSPADHARDALDAPALTYTPREEAAPPLVPMPVPRPLAPPVVAAADSGPAADLARPSVPPVIVPAETPVPVTTAPAPPPAETVDPHAPRRDAPIFRLLQRNSQPAPAPTDAAPREPARAEEEDKAGDRDDEAGELTVRTEGEAAPRDVDRTPRRYSVHRGNGQQPDRLALTGSIALDSGSDLAAPPETPTVVREVNGRLQAVTPPGDPVL